MSKQGLSWRETWSMASLKEFYAGGQAIFGHPITLLFNLEYLDSFLGQLSTNISNQRPLGHHR